MTKIFEEPGLSDAVLLAMNNAGRRAQESACPTILPKTTSETILGTVFSIDEPDAKTPSTCAEEVSVRVDGVIEGE